MTIQSDEPGVFSRNYRALTVGLVLAMTLNGFLSLAIATVMPMAEQDLGGIKFYGWAFSAYLLASIVGITWAGERADRRGPGMPLAVGMLVLAIGLVVAGTATHMAVIVLGRGIQGLGAGALPAIAYVVLGRGYPARLRPRMLAMFATAWVVPGLLGPALAGVLAELFNWRAAFLVFIPVIPLSALLTLPPLFKLAPEPGGHRESRLLHSVGLAVAAGVALSGLTVPNIFLGMAMVTVGIIAAVQPMRTIMPRGTFTAARGLPAAVAGTGVLNMTFFGAEAFIPYMLATHRGYSTVLVGFVLTSTSITWAAGSWTQERLVRTWSRAKVATIGSIVVTGSLCLLPLVVFDFIHGAWVAAIWGVGAFGIGLVYPTFSLELLSSSTVGHEGEAASAMKLNETLLAAVGVGLAGSIVAVGESSGWETGALVGVFLLMAALSLLTIGTSRRLAPGDHGSKSSPILVSVNAE